MLVPAPSADIASRSSSSAGHASTRSSKTLAGKAALIVAATALLALCAHVSVALPFTPIPVTMQTFAVLLIGVVLGPVSGAIAMVLYLAEGALGLPVFSPHGLPGVARLVGPSAGYLLSYPFAAFLAGTVAAFAQRLLPKSVAFLSAVLLGDALLLTAGAAWLMTSLHLSLASAFRLGMLPFFAGEAVKLALLTVTLTALERSKPSRR